MKSKLFGKKVFGFVLEKNKIYKNNSKIYFWSEISCLHTRMYKFILPLNNLYDNI